MKTSTFAIIGTMALLSSLMAQTVPVINSYKPSGVNSLEARIDNLTVGHSYAVLSYPTNSYPNFVYDIFNDKAIVDAVFTADSTSKTQLVSKDLPFEKFTYVMDLDSYNGPNPSILSPSEGKAVSGDFNVQLSGRPPLLPYKSEIYLVSANNGKTFLVGVLEQSPAVVTISSAMYGNGPATIYVVSTAKVGVPAGDAGNNQYFYQHTIARNIFITNNVEAVNFEEVTSGYASIPLASHGPLLNAPYVLSVSDENENILYTTTGQFVNGSAQADWDHTSNSVPIDVTGHFYRYDISASSSGALAKTRVKPLNDADPNQQYTFFRCFGGSHVLASRLMTTEQDPDANDWQSITSILNGLGDNTYYTILWSDNLSWTREPLDYWNTKGVKVIMQASQTNDLSYITNALSAYASPMVGGWIWHGHGGPADLAYGLDNFITVDIHYSDIGRLRGNSFKIVTSSGANGQNTHGIRFIFLNPLLETWLFGCSTAKDADWAIVTGTAPFDYTTRPNLSKTLFFGYSGLMNSDDSTRAFSGYAPGQWCAWSDTPASQIINSALNAYPEVMNYGPRAFGHPSCDFVGD